MKWAVSTAGANHNEEGAAIAMPSEEVYVVCIRRAQPVFVKLVLGGTKEVLDTRPAINRGRKVVDAKLGEAWVISSTEMEVRI